MNHDWQEPVTIRPVGVVQSPLKEFDQIPSYQEEVALCMREDLAPGLLGLEHFSHLHVIYRQHRREEWKRRDLIPEGQDKLVQPQVGEPSCKGIYTSRSPARPSGMGSCIVEILRVEGNRVIVRGLDAVDGTPILDIKIYIPQYDSFPNAIVPLHWCQKLKMERVSKLLHWDTMNISLTLGMRAGRRLMHALSATRGCGARATVQGGMFFAQGVEAVTGCSSIDGTLQFTERPKSLTEWFVRLDWEGRSAELHVIDRLYSGADEVLTLEDDCLFKDVVLPGA